ncbi:glycosyltransferase family 2 protein [Patescibacteria group bacterium]|nr:glycosyltransferase family 2 protein [Patescibacteria group bacterium]
MDKDRKISISVCNIVKNEEKQIGGFLSSLVNFADEIIIVDTGSTDNTLKIINSFMASHGNIKLYEYKLPGVFHYGKAKNYSISKATKDYIIILDTDERLSEDFKSKIRDYLLEHDNKVFRIKRVDESVTHLIDNPERILKNNCGILYCEQEKNRVHENLNYTGEEVEIFEEIVWHQQRWQHYIYRPQRIFPQLELQIERTPKTKSFFRHLIRGIWYFNYRFKKLYFKRKLYKDGKAGFKYAFIRAFDAFLIQFFVGLKPQDGQKYWKDESEK